jgi:hypothetical protein
MVSGSAASRFRLLFDGVADGSSTSVTEIGRGRHLCNARGCRFDCENRFEAEANPIFIAAQCSHT